MLNEPSSCGAIGAVPGLAETLTVLRARRARRQVRWLGRAVGVGALVVVGAVVLVAVGEGPARLVPDCAKRQWRARDALVAAREVQLTRMGSGLAPTTSLSTLGLDPASAGLRFAVTDVAGAGPAARFHVWAFVEGDAGQRGALVMNEGRAFTTTVVDVCGGY